MWKVLILLLKIIAHEPDIVMLAVGRQRQPGTADSSQPSSHRSLVIEVLLCLRPPLSYLTMRMAFGIASGLSSPVL